MGEPEGRCCAVEGSVHRLLVVVLLLAGAVGIWLLAGERPAAHPAEGVQVRVPESPPEPEALNAPIPAQEEPATAPEARVEPLVYYSNGKTAPLLNGVEMAVEIRWPSDTPWSPIARKIVDENGREYYQHEDGSLSTTVVMTDHVNDQLVGVGQVWNPAKVRPLLLDEGQPRLTPGGLVK